MTEGGKVLTVAGCLILLLHFTMWVTDRAVESQFGCNCTYVEWWGLTIGFVIDTLKHLA